tara:strand:+ start:481 stop:1320 length:840 start_codon:yes stop_codon:yes gene_type:complete
MSLVVHALFFTGLFFWHDFEFSRPKPRVVRVDLVSFAPGPSGSTAAVEPAPVQPPQPQPDASVNLNAKPVEVPPETPAPVPVLKPDISLKKKPKNIKELIAERDKKSVKKKKDQKLKPKPKKDPEEELEKARQELAKRIEAQNQEKINQALERMQSAIAARENEATQGAGQGNGQGGGYGERGSGPLELYKMVLASVISQNWVFNDVLAGMNQDLEVRVFIKILKSGEIRDISYETRSGNQYLDESAKKAVRRSNPLPELPPGMTSYDVVLGFTPKGLK